ncbi:MAG: helix-turn-helix domain-containing protein [Desulfovibrio sp.]|jgi:DNA-binding XRE family transcriptional regulator|nr:helix-turn-helix domain-containing protein [Desulfovibrio sp.]
MLERTKKPRTDAVALSFTGPAAKVREAMDAMRALGFQEAGDSLPWREALGYSDEQLPGVFLTGARYREGMTQVELAERTGIPRRHISEMENGKRPIGKQNARKLAEVLNVNARRLLSV